MLSSLLLLAALSPAALAQAVTAEIPMAAGAGVLPSVELGGDSFVLSTISMKPEGALTLHRMDGTTEAWSARIDPALVPIPAVLSPMPAPLPGSDWTALASTPGEVRLYRASGVARIDPKTGQTRVQILNAGAIVPWSTVVVSPDGLHMAALTTHAPKSQVDVTVYGPDLKAAGHYVLDVPGHGAESRVHELLDLHLDNQGRLVAVWSESGTALLVERRDARGQSSQVRIDLGGARLRQVETRLGADGALALAAELGRSGKDFDELLVAAVDPGAVRFMTRKPVRDLVVGLKNPKLDDQALDGLDATPDGGWIVRMAASVTNAEVLDYAHDGALRWTQPLTMDTGLAVQAMPVPPTSGSFHGLNVSVAANAQMVMTGAPVTSRALGGGYALFPSGPDSIRLVYTRTLPWKKELASTILRLVDGAIATSALPLDVSVLSVAIPQMHQSPSGDLSIVTFGNGGSRSNLVRIDQDAAPGQRPADGRQPTSRAPTSRGVSR